MALKLAGRFVTPQAQSCRLTNPRHNNVLQCVQALNIPRRHQKFDARHCGSLPANKTVPSSHLHEESHLKVLRLLEANPSMSQRELAEAVGISLGKLNFCINALLAKGHIKMQNFRNSQNRLSYYYLLTPAGIAHKVAITSQFLKRRVQEYEALKAEIEALKSEVEHPTGKKVQKT